MSDEDYDQGFAEGYYQGLSTDKEKSFLILAARIEELKKENEKLRAALKRIAEQDAVEMALDPQWARRAARAALGEKNDN